MGTFANARGKAFEGDILLAIHDAAGALLGTLETRLSAPAHGEATVELVWDAGSAAPGAYSASAWAVAEGDGATYGPVMRPFQVVHVAYLPLVLRSS